MIGEELQRFLDDYDDDEELEGERVEMPVTIDNRLYDSLVMYAEGNALCMNCVVLDLIAQLLNRDATEGE